MLTCVNLEGSRLQEDFLMAHKQWITLRFADRSSVLGSTIHPHKSINPVLANSTAYAILRCAYAWAKSLGEV